MGRHGLAGSIAAALVACAAPSPVPVAAPTGGAPSTTPPAGASAGAGSPVACGAPWTLGVVGGSAQIVVLCPSDVRREALDPNGPLAPSLAPALDPARDRVCGCAKRMAPPPYVDLVFTAKPGEGTVTVQAKEDDDDPDAGSSFIACVGAFTAKAPRAAVSECASGGSPTLVYPVRLELTP